MLKHCSSLILIPQMMAAIRKAKKNSRKLHLNQHQGKVSLEKNLPQSPGQVYQEVPRGQSLGEETSKCSLKLGFLNGLMEPWESGSEPGLCSVTPNLYRDENVPREACEKTLVNFQTQPNDFSRDVPLLNTSFTKFELFKSNSKLFQLQFSAKNLHHDSLHLLPALVPSIYSKWKSCARIL